MNFKPSRLLRKRLLLLGAVALLLMSFRTADRYFEISKNMEIFGNVYAEVNKVYVDETNPTELMRTAIDEMLGSLDPYTNYYSESQVVESRLLNSGQYSGIGAEIGLREGQVLILQLYEGGPADTAGLRVGDVILKVDREPVTGTDKDVDDVENLLLGEKGAPVALTIEREGEANALKIEVVRGGTEVQQENVPFYGMVNDTIGYVLLSGFMQDAGKEVAEATQALQKENRLTGLILDLRGNPGGRLDEAVNVTNTFVPQGELIVEMRGRTPDSRNKFFTRRNPVDTELPLTVLVNRRSASASEIVSGSLQDLDRAVVIGERSFGKGLVQNVRPLTDNGQSQLKITIAKYYTPSGRCIQAIDYAQRRQGNDGRTPDSLVQQFTTRAGRPVFDGAGIEPDVAVPHPRLQPVTQALRDQNIIFDFVTAYANGHPELPGDPRTFVLDDAIYEDFLAFVRERDFEFRTSSDKEINRLSYLLERFEYDEALQSEVEALKTELAGLKDQDLDKHRDEIAPQLKRELINRYYYKQGVLEASFTDDPDILKAVEVLNDPTRYRRILANIEE